MSDTQQEEDVRAAVEEVAKAAARNWGWFLALGIACIVLGVLAIVYPLIASVTMKIFIGWLLLLAGIMCVVHAFGASDWKGVVLNLLMAAVLIIGGGWLAFFPIEGLVALTAFLAILFIAQGVIQCVLGFQLRPDEGWGWMVFSGIMAILVGSIIWLGLPGTALWALGLLAGINLIFTGFSYVALGMVGRRSGDTATA